MNVYFLMEDSYGPSFIQKFIKKKQEEGSFTNVRIVNAVKITISSKMSRVAYGIQGLCDRIIIMVDADGKPAKDKRECVKRLTSDNRTVLPEIVVFKNEIEDWICYSMGVDPGSAKPSSVLKHKVGYKKKRLGQFSHEIDCSKLDQCESFQELRSALYSRS